MRAPRWPVTPFVLLLLAVASSRLAAQTRYPASRVAPVADTLFGQVLVDPYRWLEDQAAPDTRAWIAAQNAFRDSLMAGLPGRDTIARRLQQLLATDQQGIPAARGGRYFYTRRRADQDLSVICMRQGLAGPEVPLVDPNLMAAEVPFSVGIAALSFDGTLMAYSIQRGGEDERLIRFYDVVHRRMLPDALPKSRQGVDIAPDNRTLFVTRYTRQGPRLYVRTLGDSAASERLIFGGDLGEEKAIGVEVSRDGRWLLISVSTGTSGGNDLYLMDLRTLAAPVPMVTGSDRNYYAAFAGGRIVIHTDWNAPKGRIMVAEPAAPARDRWREIVAEGPNPIAGFSLVGGHVWVEYLENVVGRIRGYDLAGRPYREIAMPSLGSVSGLAGEFDRPEGFFSFTSFNTPATIYRYVTTTSARTIWWRQSVPFDPAGFVVEQVWYRSKDSTRIPMFLAHRRGIALEGTNPVYLTGYGGFNISLTPAFSAQYAVWMEHGGIVAVPNLRGGGEFGEAWHRAGMYASKQNVFDDFIAAGEWLVANRYTTSDRLAIAGGSNGGLLVTAALTQRPDLFRAVVCSYPLVDMIRYQKFLLGRYWVSEYGSAEDSAQFRYIRAYSPYQNVRPGTRYPAVLFETGDGDTRVAPLHARKMAALLQAASAASVAERPILIHYDTEAGHSGGLPVRKVVDDTATRLEFVMWQLGMLPGGASASH